jgi:hypothetical protein
LALSEHVFGRWLFSHEDEDGARVYRPRGSAFAPSRRPRDGFDIEADGTFRSYAPGAADASVASAGRWTLAAPDRLAVTSAAGGTRMIEVVEAAPGLLKLRGAPA